MKPVVPKARSEIRPRATDWRNDGRDKFAEGQKLLREAFHEDPKLRKRLLDTLDAKIDRTREVAEEVLDTVLDF